MLCQRTKIRFVRNDTGTSLVIAMTNHSLYVCVCMCIYKCGQVLIYNWNSTEMCYLTLLLHNNFPEKANEWCRWTFVAHLDSMWVIILHKDTHTHKPYMCLHCAYVHYVGSMIDDNPQQFIRAITRPQKPSQSTHHASHSHVSCKMWCWAKSICSNLLSFLPARCSRGSLQGRCFSSWWLWIHTTTSRRPGTVLTVSLWRWV